MPIPQRHKVKSIEIGSVGEEDEESSEGKSLIHVENEVQWKNQQLFVDHVLDRLNLDSSYLPSGFSIS